MGAGVTLLKAGREVRTHMEGAVMSLSILDVMALLAPYIVKQQSRIAPLKQHFVPCALTLKMSSDNESILRSFEFYIFHRFLYISMLTLGKPLTAQLIAVL